MNLVENPRGGFDVYDGQLRFAGWAPSILKARHLVPRANIVVGRARYLNELRWGRRRQGWEVQGARFFEHCKGGVKTGLRHEGKPLFLDMGTGETYIKATRTKGALRMTRA